MGGAILTRREEVIKEFEIKLEAKLLKALEHKDSKKFEIHNKAINKINKINSRLSNMKRLQNLGFMIEKNLKYQVCYEH
ncbi:MAG: hypothetical protein Q9M97_02520 [Candidatus Gracilibacteria bacterium]|nr:hypothetical protein [Candidatus Gracilibacteria bacterium]